MDFTKLYSTVENKLFTDLTLVLTEKGNSCA